MGKVAIIYYSSTGTTYGLAKAVEEGAREAGAETKLLKVKETAPEAAINSNEGWKKNVEATRDVAEATTDEGGRDYFRDADALWRGDFTASSVY
jgi:NAD(P)H dehydrogenase (quinone)